MGHAVLAHVGGAVLGSVVDERVRVDASLLEALELLGLSLGLLLGDLGLSGAATTLPDAVENGKDDERTAQAAGAGVDGDLCGGSERVPLVADRLLGGWRRC